MAHHSAELQVSDEATSKRATQKAQKKINRLFNVTLHIAVTGESGVGKSSFINAIRGLDDEDEGAAETGVVETTSVPTPYPHPQMPNVIYWDLPGIGTQNFKAKTYFKDVKFETYDFFIIISSSGFTENDLRLAKEIRKRKKLFYFVRSNIDSDIEAESNKKCFNRQQTLCKIRENCQENLKDMGEPKIFLISSRYLYDFDFQDLVDTLMSELPQHRRSALLQSVPVSSMAILEKKIRIYKKAAWAAAALSGAIAVVPVPGVSVASDMAILILFLTKCFHSFGLDEKSIEKLSKRVNKPHLKSLIKSKLLGALTSKTERLTLSVLVDVCGIIPAIGSSVAVVLSFVFTYKLLKHAVKELADTSREVLREAGIE